MRRRLLTPSDAPAVKQVRGFTLVELMIVVAIIGVLAALATYGAARYLKHAKTAEAMRAIGALEKGEQSRFQVDVAVNGLGSGLFVHEFCDSTPSVPTSMTQIAARKYSSSTADWSDPGWACLHFAIGEPQNFQYSTMGAGTGTGATYVVSAQGDLDGNTTASLFQISGVGSTNGDTARTSYIVVNGDE